MNSSEWLCLWYLRLNGYFTMPNFICHGGLTEVDVLGVRFPHSSEGFQDHERLRIPEDCVDIVIAEAKRGPIDHLNRPWTSPESGALDYVLRRVGIVAGEKVNGLAGDLYKKRSASLDGFTIRIICFGQSISQDLRTEGVTFVSWPEVFEFIHQRFHDHEKLKEEHQAWDHFGQYLWKNLNPKVPEADKFFANWERHEQRRT